MNKKKATSANTSGPESKTYTTATSAQQARILTTLQTAGPTGSSTIELREQLDIMHPSGRVMELREQGYRIDTVWTVTTNAQGNSHRCARYVLQLGGEVLA